LSPSKYRLLKGFKVEAVRAITDFSCSKARTAPKFDCSGAKFLGSTYLTRRVDP